MITESDIQAMADTIAERFDPEKIILFGSYARGEATEDSDIDLLIIRQTGETYFERPVPIRMALLPFPCAFDILVLTPEEFQRECAVNWTVFYDADTNGRTLYERAS